jgi:hypothetical protein
MQCILQFHFIIEKTAHLLSFGAFSKEGILALRFKPAPLSRLAAFVPPFNGALPE